MQIGKNQGKTTFALFNFKHFRRIYTCGCGIFLLSLLSFVSSFFSLPLYFLFENRIDPLLGFIMSHCICIENEKNLKFCKFCKVFLGNLNLKISLEFIFTTTHRSRHYFLQIQSELATIKLP